MIELRSDTFTQPTRAMRDAMATAELGDDVYGEDPTVRALEELAADRLGKGAACFLPSGTMANLCALLAHVPRGGKVVVGDESDIYVYEAGGASVCGGLVYHPVPTRSDGTLSLTDLEAAFPDDPDDPQFALPGVVCLENTHNRCGGAVLPPAHLAEVHAFARERGVPLHLDGARLFNAAAALGTPVASIAEHADSVQFCLSKGLCAPIGSMLVGGAEFVARARRVRKMLGGGMRQAGVVAAAGLVALDRMTDRLTEDHRTARFLADGLAGLPNVELAAPVTTNIVLFRVVDTALTWPDVVAAARTAGLAIGELGHGRLRAVTHAGVTEADVARAVDVIEKIVRNAA